MSRIAHDWSKSVKNHFFWGQTLRPPFWIIHSLPPPKAIILDTSLGPYPNYDPGPARTLDGPVPRKTVSLVFVTPNRIDYTKFVHLLGQIRGILHSVLRKPIVWIVRVSSITFVQDWYLKIETGSLLSYLEIEQVGELHPGQTVPLLSCSFIKYLSQAIFTNLLVNQGYIIVAFC